MAQKIYNKFYTKEKWDITRTYNKMLLRDFLLDLESRGRKQTTIDQYFNDGRILCIYILDFLENKEIHELKKKDFRDIVLHFRSLGMSNARVNRIMSMARTMMSFAEDDEDYENIEINYAAKIKGLPKEPIREIVFLTDEDVTYIYNKLIESGKYQQALLCGMLYDSCSRRNEVAQLKKNDISQDRVVCNTLVVAKRGKRYRPIYNDMTKRAYELYMNERGTDDIESLWIMSNSRTDATKRLYEWVVSWRSILQEKTGVLKEFNPHSWRHSAATNYDNGTHYFCQKLGRPLTLFELQKLMNHSDISTTQAYLKCRDEEILVNIFS